MEIGSYRLCCKSTRDLGSNDKDYCHVRLDKAANKVFKI